MLIGFTVRRAAFTLTVGAWAALWAAVAAGVIPRWLSSFTIIAVIERKGNVKAQYTVYKRFKLYLKQYIH